MFAHTKTMAEANEKLEKLNWCKQINDFLRKQYNKAEFREIETYKYALVFSNKDNLLQKDPQELRFYLFNINDIQKIASPKTSDQEINSFFFKKIIPAIKIKISQNPDITNWYEGAIWKIFEDFNNLNRQDNKQEIENTTQQSNLQSENQSDPDLKNFKNDINDVLKKIKKESYNYDVGTFLRMLAQLKQRYELYKQTQKIDLTTLSNKLVQREIIEMIIFSFTTAAKVDEDTAVWLVDFAGFFDNLPKPRHLERKHLNLLKFNLNLLPEKIDDLIALLSPSDIEKLKLAFTPLNFTQDDFPKNNVVFNSGILLATEGKLKLYCHYWGLLKPEESIGQSTLIPYKNSTYLLTLNIDNNEIKFILTEDQIIEILLEEDLKFNYWKLYEQNEIKTILFTNKKEEEKSYVNLWLFLRDGDFWSLSTTDKDHPFPDCIIELRNFLGNSFYKSDSLKLLQDYVSSHKNTAAFKNITNPHANTLISFITESTNFRDLGKKIIDLMVNSIEKSMKNNNLKK